MRTRDTMKMVAGTDLEDISLLSVTDADYDRLRIIPLCREFSLHDGIRNVFLDILAVTETGRLILVECNCGKPAG